MRLSTILLLLCAFMCAQTAFAQKQKKKPARDVEVIDFGDTESNPEDEPVYHGLILKTSPFAFVFGRQPVELEKEISDFVSLQAGIGLTFQPLWTEYESLLQEIREGDDGFCSSSAWATDECDYYGDYTIREGKLGWQLSLSPRLFFDSDGFEGPYIAPVLRYSVQKFEVQSVVDRLTSIVRDPDNLQEESIKNFDLVVHYGAQTLYPKLTVEWFIGAGIRLRNNLRQDVGFNAFQESGSVEREFKDKKFRFEAGLRVGFQL